MWLHFLLLLALSAAALAAQRQVTIRNGTVVGFTVGAASARAWQFLGIPFAEKPLGPLRFAKPRALQKGWSEALIASTAPNRCPQIPNSLLIDDKVDKALVSPFDEDCLYLNVWTPESRDQPKAVMLWFHGGGYVIGEGLPSYHGAPLAALHDVVVVTAHYRLGALGFLRLGEDVGGNWGMFDQQAALRWVRENIAAFGGDPKRITIFGESAGGSSVSLHLLNPDSADLFHRIIAQSGSAFSTWAFSPAAARMAEDHRQFAAALNCSGPAPLECLRTKDAQDLLAKQPGFRWLPVVDGDFLRAAPPELEAAKKDVMMGVNEDEGGMIIELILKWAEQAAKSSPEAAQVPPEQLLVTQLFSHFPFYPEKASPLVMAAMDPLLRSHVDPKDQVLNLKRISKAYGDFSFVCPMNQFADHLEKQGTAPFIFLFGHRSSFSPYPLYVGATHGDEVAYVFRLHIPHPNILNMTQEEQGLAKRMAEEWTSFAKTGQPASPEWRPFSAAKKEFFEFALPGGPRQGGVHRDDCGFWTEALPKLQAAWRAQQEAARQEGGADVRLVAVIGVLIGILLFRAAK